MKSFREACELILGEINQSLDAVNPEQIEEFIKALLEARQVFVIGVGRVMLSLRAMAKRFNHIGIPTHCVGDISEPAITQDDMLIIGSGSGESVVPVAIAKVAHKFKAKIVHIGSNPNSSLTPITDIFIRIPVKTKLNLPDEIQSEQIMSSLFEQSLYILSDAVALYICNQKQIDLKKLWQYHANLE